MSRQVVLAFDRGTLTLSGDIAEGELEAFITDPRTVGLLRAPAIAYRRALAQLIRGGWQVDDQARGYEALTLGPGRDREPYPHQAEALAAWQGSGRRGVVVLPTGAGKTYVAELAIALTARSTLIVAPTIDLMNQWMRVLTVAFGADLIGGLGGGMNDVRAITATTYDSAYLHMDRLGDRFGLVVFDEAHHLPGASYAQAAELAIAPFRLGLTATPERSDGSHTRLDRLVGPIVYRREIRELAGLYLADYETKRVVVSLTPAERAAYDAARHDYRSFVSESGIRMSAPDGWSRFLQLSSRSPRGRRAWRAWREQRGIAMRSSAKLELLWQLLVRHWREQLVIFTADNDTVYEISRRHLVPAITHQTPTKERQRILADFEAGKLRAIVTSRVLNEGVDIPAASVGIVLSGSSSVREHVQRLGRILRRSEGKRALLYEVVTGETTEERTSDRRREHDAYDGVPPAVGEAADSAQTPPC